MQIRINKYLAEHGYCSRRGADALLNAGVVFINGKRAGLGDKVEETDRVRVLEQKIKKIVEKIYLLLNKPAGYSTTTEKTNKPNVIDLVPPKHLLIPVGKLDVQSCGLVIMTNDGELANKLTHPRYEHEKEYDVTLDKEISDSHLKRFTEGVDLNGKKTLPAIVHRLGTHRFTIVLQQGHSREIRRMCDAFGYTVRILRRTRMLTLRLGLLDVGKTRPLTPAEIETLKKESPKNLK